MTYSWDEDDEKRYRRDLAALKAQVDANNDVDRKSRSLLFVIIGVVALAVGGLYLAYQTLPF